MRVARWLAQAVDARLAILTVQGVLARGPVPAGRLLSTEGGESESSDLSHFLAWLGEDAPDCHNEHAEVALAYGVPGIEISRFAGLRAVDLIVAGRRPRTPEHRLLLGETGDALVRRSDIPVLFVPPEVGTVQRVLLALDGSDRCPAVLEAGLKLARAGRAKAVDAVTVEPELIDEMNGAATSPRTGRSLRVGSTLTRRAAEAPGGAIPLSVRRGNPIEEVLAEVARSRPDVLVIGYRRGGPPKVVGPKDIARNLLYAAPCAVFTVPL